MTDLILDTYVLDSGLHEISGSRDLHALSAEPDAFADVATYSLGHTTITISQPAATTGGRHVLIAQTDIMPSDNGSATWWAIVDQARSLVLARGLLTTAATMTVGQVCHMPAMEIKQALS